MYYYFSLIVSIDVLLESEQQDKDVRCPYWGKYGYCSINQEIAQLCLYSCIVYKNIAPAIQPYPYPIIALHPYQPTPTPTVPPVSLDLDLMALTFVFDIFLFFHSDTTDYACTTSTNHCTTTTTNTTTNTTTTTTTATTTTK